MGFLRAIKLFLPLIVARGLFRSPLRFGIEASDRHTSCWLTKGEDDLENVETVNSEGLARIDQAIERLANRNALWLWLDAPDRDGNGVSVGTRVDWFRISKFLRVDVLPPHHLTGLFEEAVCVLAARRGLISIKKTSPFDPSTVFKPSPICLTYEFHRKQSETLCSEFIHPLNSVHWSESWVQKNKTLIEFTPGNHPTPGSLSSTTFVTRDTLEAYHLRDIEHFLFRAEAGPFERHIKATDEVMFALSVLRDVEQMEQI